MFYIIGTICLASGVYYYKKNKNFNFYIKNKKQELLNKCKKLKTKINYALDDLIDKQLNDLEDEIQGDKDKKIEEGQFNLYDEFYEDSYFYSRCVTPFNVDKINLETIVEVNEESDTPKNKKIVKEEYDIIDLKNENIKINGEKSSKKLLWLF